jgi:hypothetical protein
MSFSDSKPTTTITSSPSLVRFPLDHIYPPLVLKYLIFSRLLRAELAERITCYYGFRLFHDATVATRAQQPEAPIFRYVEKSKYSADSCLQTATKPFLFYLHKDGGGASGLSSLIVLREFMKRVQSQTGLSEMPRPCEVFDLIAGTGRGG